jgi:hypothetical protein
MLVTRVFAGLSAMAAASDGLPDLHRVVFPHPLNHLPEEEIRTAARHLADEALGSLVESASRVGSAVTG